ncbi:MAG: YCF48-related protein [Brumimicrobium sp.]|nr:YCF48-related protein [Brumimicrobium sp.]
MKKTLLFLISIIILGIEFKANSQSWWPQTSNTNVNLMNINYYDDNNGMAFGDTLSTAIKSSNQGAVWNNLNPSFTTGDIRSSAYLTSSSIIAVGIYDVTGGNGAVMRSTNNGVTWTSDVTLPEKLFDVSFVNSTEGWISGENGYIAKTTNGGINWAQLNSGTGEDIFSLYFISSTEGWAVGTVDAMAVILHTVNGGTNWTLQTSNITTPLFSVFFVNSMNGWAVGEGGVILTTSDGGLNWSAQASGTINGLNDVYFLDANKGWAVGNGGTVIKTIDGGATWTSEVSGTTRDINSIEMRHDSLGWFCGDDGVIHVYSVEPINSISENSLSTQEGLLVYPNPSTESVMISLTIGKGTTDIHVYDGTGKLVKNLITTENSFLMSCEDFKPGVYLIKAISNHGNIQTAKLVVE